MQRWIVVSVALLMAFPAFGQDVGVIQESLNVVTDYSGDAMFLGEVRNDNDHDVGFVNVEFTLKDKEGKLLDVVSGYVHGSVGRTRALELYEGSHLSPGERGFFKVWSSTPLDEMGSYEVRTKWQQADPIDIPGAVVLVMDSFATREDSGGDLVYLGEIRNDTPEHLIFVQIAFAAKDATGKIVDVSYGYVSGSPFRTSFGIETDTHLAPDEVGVFKISTRLEATQVESYIYKITFDPRKGTSVAATTWGAVKSFFR